MAQWADYPTVHLDLTARNAWLGQWAVDNTERVRNDADYYDAQAAGWWAWAKSNMIAGFPGESSTQIPHVKDNGLSAARGVKPGLRDGIPAVPDKSRGKGVAMQRTNDSIPAVCAKAYVNRESQKSKYRGTDMPLDGTRLQPWMRALCERLKGVIVLCRSWESGLTKPMTMEAYMFHHPCAVFLDPPYLTTNRTKFYDSDHSQRPDDAATGAYEWAVERGQHERYRIAYACHDGDFPVPDGWVKETMSFQGLQSEARRAAKQDCIMFSPHCFPRPAHNNADLFTDFS